MPLTGPPPTPVPFLRRAAFATVLVGIGLRLVQWLGNTSFWLDEANLAENLVNSGMAELLKDPLRWAQMAPVGFLFLEGIAARLLGPGEMALRFLPFWGSVVAVVAFWIVARRLLNDAGVLVAVGAMALNPLLISLAGVLKHYSTDVTTIVLLLLAVTILLKEKSWGDGGMGPEDPASKYRWYWIGCGAGLLGFLSIPSILVAGPALLALAWRDRVHGPVDLGWWRTRGLPLVIWGSLSSLAALRERLILSRGWGPFMAEYWADMGAFLPPFLQEPLALLEVLRAGLFRDLLFQPYIIGGLTHGVLVDTRVTTYGLFLLGILGALGLALYGRKNRFGWCILFWGPFALAVALARLGHYPLDPRTVVFLLPLAFLFFGQGVDLIAKGKWLRGPKQRVVLAAMFLLPFVRVAAGHPPPFHVAPVRELVAELAQRRAPHEPVYGFWDSGAILKYYGDRFGLSEGVKPASQRNLLTNFDEISEFRGQESVWVLFPNPQGAEKDVFLCLLKTIGEETETAFFQASEWWLPLSLHRFDLSDERRWDEVDLEKFVSGSGQPPHDWPGCEVARSAPGS